MWVQLTIVLTVLCTVFTNALHVAHSDVSREPNGAIVHTQWNMLQDGKECRSPTETEPTETIPTRIATTESTTRTTTRRTTAGTSAWTRAGTSAGTDAGISAGTGAGISAGPSAGTSAWTSAGTGAGSGAGTSAGPRAGTSAPDECRKALSTVSEIRIYLEIAINSQTEYKFMNEKDMQILSVLKDFNVSKVLTYKIITLIAPGVCEEVEICNGPLVCSTEYCVVKQPKRVTCPAIHPSCPLVR
ncbi:unnamed protein product [Dicrocoelium dendriticum]|nr:unnamed protein product [Dicrocoelium dendriticum]